MPWCPYTDRDLPDEATNSEHIIPLSLGGVNEFCIPVEREFNSRLGSKIDGAIANDFLTLVRRQKFDARGHSNKPPIPILRKSYLDDGARPVQVMLHKNDGLIVWDAISRSRIERDELSNKIFSSSFMIGRHDRKKFLAKVVLSAGYFIFGALFRDNVRHNEIRALMNFESSSDASDFMGFGTRLYDEFSPVSEKDSEQQIFDSYCCQIINGSCVIAIPGPQNVGFIVGVLGKWVGTLNVPANTDCFPCDGQYDLGHVVALYENNLIRKSYREFVQDMHDMINERAVNDGTS